MILTKGIDNITDILREIYEAADDGGFMSMSSGDHDNRIHDKKVNPIDAHQYAKTYIQKHITNSDNILCIVRLAYDINGKNSYVVSMLLYNNLYYNGGIFPCDESYISLQDAVMNSIGAFDTRLLLFDNIVFVNNYPKPGVEFADFTKILDDYVLQNLAVNRMIEQYDVYKKISPTPNTTIIALDARGFIWGSLVASKLKTGIRTIRKKGKMPGETISIKFEKEYGSDEFEISSQYTFSKNCTYIIVDDVLATGGTIEAAILLMEKCGVTREQIVIMCPYRVKALDHISEPKLAGTKYIGLF